jgi:SAM-dependent methyltransferase
MDALAEIFLKQWSLYRKIVDSDLMSHRSFYAQLRRMVEHRSGVWSFLDLGCGDASSTLQALHGLPVGLYTGVDLAPQAITLAADNLRASGLHGGVVDADFRQYLRDSNRLWDVIFIGFSFHHLIGGEKAEFAGLLRQTLAPDGEWIFLEPLMTDGETRAGYLLRWKAEFDLHWTAFSEDERQAIWEHVSTCDHPETLEQFLEIGQSAGFQQLECLGNDPTGLYAMFRARNRLNA